MTPPQCFYHAYKCLPTTTVHVCLKLLVHVHVHYATFLAPTRQQALATKQKENDGVMALLLQYTLIVSSVSTMMIAKDPVYMILHDYLSYRIRSLLYFTFLHCGVS